MAKNDWQVSVLEHWTLNSSVQRKMWFQLFDLILRKMIWFYLILGKMICDLAQRFKYFCLIICDLALWFDLWFAHHWRSLAYTGRWWVGCYIWYIEELPGPAAVPPSPLLAVPNVTAHPSTASVYQLHNIRIDVWRYNCLCSLKG